MSYNFSFAIGTISTVKLPTLVQQLGQCNRYPAQPRVLKVFAAYGKSIKVSKKCKNNVNCQKCQAGSCLAFAAQDPLPQMKWATVCSFLAKFKKMANVLKPHDVKSLAGIISPRINFVFHLKQHLIYLISWRRAHKSKRWCSIIKCTWPVAKLQGAWQHLLVPCPFK